MKIPPNFSAEQWQRLNDEQKLRFWEGWVAGLRFALDHVTPDGLGVITHELAGAEEAMNEFRHQ